MTFPANDTIDTYGGLLSDAQPVEDPSVDMSASSGNAIAASVAGMTNVCMMAWMRFLTDSTTPTLSPSRSNNAAWGSATGVRPLIVHSGTGIYDAQWPATIVDGTGTTQSINIQRATSFVEGAVCYHAKTLVTSANTVRIYTFNAAGTANDIVGTTIYVEIGG